MNQKYDQLKEYLKSLGSLVVAFSGGVDSTFLLKAAKDVLGDRMIAVTIMAPFHLYWEITEAAELTQELGIKHVILEKTEIMENIRYNPADRCYLCKKTVFQEILDYAVGNGYNAVADGTNFDDTKDYRPGMKALAELQVISPLLKIGITKEEVRAMSKELGLPTWNKPAYACILSRIQYGQEITHLDLRMIESAELYMINLGFKTVRVRLHDKLARIEVNPSEIRRLFDPELLNTITVEFKRLGFKYVTLDLEGYRTGSQNEVL